MLIFFPKKIYITSLVLIFAISLLPIAIATLQRLHHAVNRPGDPIRAPHLDDFPPSFTSTQLMTTPFQNASLYCSVFASPEPLTCWVDVTYPKCDSNTFPIESNTGFQCQRGFLSLTADIGSIHPTVFPTTKRPPSPFLFYHKQNITLVISELPVGLDYINQIIFESDRGKQYIIPYADLSASQPRFHFSLLYREQLTLEDYDAKWAIGFIYEGELHLWTTYVFSIIHPCSFIPTVNPSYSVLDRDHITNCKPWLPIDHTVCDDPDLVDSYAKIDNGCYQLNMASPTIFQHKLIDHIYIGQEISITNTQSFSHVLMILLLNNIQQTKYIGTFTPDTFIFNFDNPFLLPITINPEVSYQVYLLFFHPTTKLASKPYIYSLLPFPKWLSYYAPYCSPDPQNLIIKRDTADNLSVTCSTCQPGFFGIRCEFRITAISPQLPSPAPSTPQFLLYPNHPIHLIIKRLYIRPQLYYNAFTDPLPNSPPFDGGFTESTTLPFPFSLFIPELSAIYGPSTSFDSESELPPPLGSVSLIKCVKNPIGNTYYLTLLPPSNYFVRYLRSFIDVDPNQPLDPGTIPPIALNKPAGVTSPLFELKYTLDAGINGNILTPFTQTILQFQLKSDDCNECLINNRDGIAACSRVPAWSAENHPNNNLGCIAVWRFAGYRGHRTAKFDKLFESFGVGMLNTALDDSQSPLTPRRSTVIFEPIFRDGYFGQDGLKASFRLWPTSEFTSYQNSDHFATSYHLSTTNDYNFYTPQIHDTMLAMNQFHRYMVWYYDIPELQQLLEDINQPIHPDEMVPHYRQHGLLQYITTITMHNCNPITYPETIVTIPSVNYDPDKQCNHIDSATAQCAYGSPLLSNPMALCTCRPYHSWYDESGERKQVKAVWVGDYCQTKITGIFPQEGKTDYKITIRADTLAPYKEHSLPTHGVLIDHDMNVTINKYIDFEIHYDEVTESHYFQILAQNVAPPFAASRTFSLNFIDKFGTILPTPFKYRLVSPYTTNFYPSGLSYKSLCYYPNTFSVTPNQDCICKSNFFGPLCNISFSSPVVTLTPDSPKFTISILVTTYGGLVDVTGWNFQITSPIGPRPIFSLFPPSLTSVSTSTHLLEVPFAVDVNLETIWVSYDSKFQFIQLTTASQPLRFRNPGGCGQNCICHTTSYLDTTTCRHTIRWGNEVVIQINANYIGMFFLSSPSFTVSYSFLSSTTPQTLDRCQIITPVSGWSCIIDTPGSLTLTSSTFPLTMSQTLSFLFIDSSAPSIRYGPYRLDAKRDADFITTYNVLFQDDPYTVCFVPGITTIRGYNLVNKSKPCNCQSGTINDSYYTYIGLDCGTRVGFGQEVFKPARFGRVPITIFPSTRTISVIIDDYNPALPDPITTHTFSVTMGHDLTFAKYIDGVSPLFMTVDGQTVPLFDHIPVSEFYTDCNNIFSSSCPPTSDICSPYFCGCAQPESLFHCDGGENDRVFMSMLNPIYASELASLPPNTLLLGSQIQLNFKPGSVTNNLPLNSLSYQISIVPPVLTDQIQPLFLSSRPNNDAIGPFYLPKVLEYSISKTPYLGRSLLKWEVSQFTPFYTSHHQFLSPMEWLRLKPKEGYLPLCVIDNILDVALFSYFEKAPNQSLHCAPSDESSESVISFCKCKEPHIVDGLITMYIGNHCQSIFTFKPSSVYYATQTIQYKMTTAPRYTPALIDTTFSVALTMDPMTRYHIIIDPVKETMTLPTFYDNFYKFELSHRKFASPPFSGDTTYTIASISNINIFHQSHWMKVFQHPFQCVFDNTDEFVPTIDLDYFAQISYERPPKNDQEGIYACKCKPGFIGPTCNVKITIVESPTISDYNHVNIEGPIRPVGPNPTPPLYIKEKVWTLNVEITPPPTMLIFDSTIQKWTLSVGADTTVSSQGGIEIQFSQPLGEIMNDSKSTTRQFIIDFGQLSSLKLFLRVSGLYPGDFSNVVYESVVGVTVYSTNSLGVNVSGSIGCGLISKDTLAGPDYLSCSGNFENSVSIPDRLGYIESDAKTNYNWLSDPIPHIFCNCSRSTSPVIGFGHICQYHLMLDPVDENGEPSDFEPDNFTFYTNQRVKVSELDGKIVLSQPDVLVLTSTLPLVKTFNLEAKSNEIVVPIDQNGFITIPEFPGQYIFQLQTYPPPDFPHHPFVYSSSPLIRWPFHKKFNIITPNQYCPPRSRCFVDGTIDYSCDFFHNKLDVTFHNSPCVCKRGYYGLRCQYQFQLTSDIQYLMESKGNEMLYMTGNFISNLGTIDPQKITMELTPFSTRQALYYSKGSVTLRPSPDNLLRFDIEGPLETNSQYFLTLFHPNFEQNIFIQPPLSVISSQDYTALVPPHTSMICNPVGTLSDQVTNPVNNQLCLCRDHYFGPRCEFRFETLTTLSDPLVFSINQVKLIVNTSFIPYGSIDTPSTVTVRYYLHAFSRPLNSLESFKFVSSLIETSDGRLIWKAQVSPSEKVFSWSHFSPPPPQFSAVSNPLQFHATSCEIALAISHLPYLTVGSPLPGSPENRHGSILSAPFRLIPPTALSTPNRIDLGLNEFGERIITNFSYSHTLTQEQLDVMVAANVNPLSDPERLQTRFLLFVHYIPPEFSLQTLDLSQAECLLQANIVSYSETTQTISAPRKLQWIPFPAPTTEVVLNLVIPQYAKIDTSQRFWLTVLIQSSLHENFLWPASATNGIVTQRFLSTQVPTVFNNYVRCTTPSCSDYQPDILEPSSCFTSPSSAVDQTCFGLGLETLTPEQKTTQKCTLTCPLFLSPSFSCLHCICRTKTCNVYTRQFTLYFNPISTATGRSELHNLISNQYKSGWYSLLTEQLSSLLHLNPNAIKLGSKWSNEALFKEHIHARPLGYVANELLPSLQNGVVITISFEPILENRFTALFNDVLDQRLTKIKKQIARFFSFFGSQSSSSLSSSSLSQAFFASSFEQNGVEDSDDSVTFFEKYISVGVQNDAQQFSITSTAAPREPLASFDTFSKFFSTKHINFNLLYPDSNSSQLTILHVPRFISIPMMPVLVYCRSHDTLETIHLCPQTPNSLPASLWSSCSVSSNLKSLKPICFDINGVSTPMGSWCRPQFVPTYPLLTSSQCTSGSQFLSLTNPRLITPFRDSQIPTALPSFTAGELIVAEWLYTGPDSNRIAIFAENAYIDEASPPGTNRVLLTTVPVAPSRGWVSFRLPYHIQSINSDNTIGLLFQVVNAIEISTSITLTVRPYPAGELCATGKIDDFGFCSCKKGQFNMKYTADFETTPCHCNSQCLTNSLGTVQTMPCDTSDPQFPTCRCKNGFIGPNCDQNPTLCSDQSSVSQCHSQSTLIPTNCEFNTSTGLPTSCTCNTCQCFQDSFTTGSLCEACSLDALCDSTGTDFPLTHQLCKTCICLPGYGGIYCSRRALFTTFVLTSEEEFSIQSDYFAPDNNTALANDIKISAVLPEGFGELSPLSTLTLQRQFSAALGVMMGDINVYQLYTHFSYTPIIPPEHLKKTESSPLLFSTTSTSRKPYTSYKKLITTSIALSVTSGTYPNLPETNYSLLNLYNQLDQLSRSRANTHLSDDILSLIPEISSFKISTMTSHDPLCIEALNTSVLCPSGINPLNVPPLIPFTPVYPEPGHEPDQTSSSTLIYIVIPVAAVVLIIALTSILLFCSHRYRLFCFNSPIKRNNKTVEMQSHQTNIVSPHHVKSGQKNALHSSVYNPNRLMRSKRQYVERPPSPSAIPQFKSIERELIPTPQFDPGLPSGWLTYADTKNQELFYVSIITQEVQRDRPSKYKHLPDHKNKRK